MPTFGHAPTVQRRFDRAWVSALPDSYHLNGDRDKVNVSNHRRRHGWNGFKICTHGGFVAVGIRAGATPLRTFLNKKKNF